MAFIPEPKYQAAANGAIPSLLTDEEAPFVDFRLERMNPDGVWGRLKAFLAAVALKLILSFAQRFVPWLRIGRWLIVTRHRDVEHVLMNPDHFRTPFNPEMAALADGATFMLGLDGPQHLRQRNFVRQWLRSDNDAALSHFTQDSQFVARALLDAAPGEIDVMKDYFTRVSTEASRGLLGLDMDDPDGFAEWSIALSAMVFGDATGDKVVRELASHAAWQMRGLVSRAIARQLALPKARCGLVGACLDDGTWTEAEIRALVMGIAIGLIPTVTLMAGNLLTWLLENRSVMQQATTAAVNGDRAELRAILLEVGRLRPALWPGQFRLIVEEIALPNGHKVPANTTVLAATAKALRDGAHFPRPGRFCVERPLDGDAVNLTFGAMPHACLGRRLATAQLVEMFGALLARPGLAAASGKSGKLKMVQAFPRHLGMRYANPERPGCHSMAMVVVPVPANCDSTTLRSSVEMLGNPADSGFAAALGSANILHFLSLNLIDAGTAEEPDPHLLLEINADGDLGHALDRLAAVAEPFLGRIFASAGWDREKSPLGAFWMRHARLNAGFPGALNGLDYDGTEGFSCADKRLQRDLADYASRALDWVQRQRFATGGRPMAKLEAVRSFIRDDSMGLNLALQPVLKSASDDDALRSAAERAALLVEGRKFHSMLFLPSSRRLGFIDYLEQTRRYQIARFIKSRDARPVWIGLAVLLLGFAALMAMPLTGAGAGWIMRSIAALMLGTGLLVTVIGGAGLFLFLRLRQAEQSDRPDDRDAAPGHVASLIAREDAPGFRQNHVLSMSVFKAGWLRRITFALAMWGIGIYCRWLARPGFILSMGTIHFARWYRLPGRVGARLLFHSNYDGNWESYLEDFVMKAHIGQTAAWSHGEGFPRSESLVLKGAQDGPRFKRWTRRQQMVTQCWWSATPGLTLDRIRTNAMIHDGLARATSDSAAREWLSLFGSQARPQSAIETEEVQTIVFRGMGRRQFGLTVGLALPQDRLDSIAVLKLLLPGHENPLVHVPPVSFGERPWGGGGDDAVATLAISAAGMVRLGVGETADSLAGFPFAFRQGMRARWRQLADPVEVEWVVDDTADLLLHFLFATESEAIAAEEELQRVIGPFGRGAVLRFVQHCGPRPHPVSNRPSVAFEPFGFRDGASQPSMRGTLSEAFAHVDDLLEPGEFILGYRANQGQVAPGPRVPRQRDPFDLLADTTGEPDQAWPAFRRLQQRDMPWRDFGRNGSFLVLRQFQQDIEGFHRFCETAAEDLAMRYPGLSRVVGAPVDGRWLAGKLVGRWQDGIALNRRPFPPGNRAKSHVDHPETTIAFGREDPRGFGCPLGAHVRRANPRDSLLPDDPGAMAITNRHRLIRRGRAWSTADGRAGLTFIALCADIERQFEFIQAQWLSAPSFHSLADEVDPLVIGGTDFTIPTSAGPVRLRTPKSYVSLQGGGYFFVPSRAALRFIVAADQPAIN